eukprot:Skav220041  [mRNA]  locus=scaffold2981:289142:289543:+ [translate_table: standard]
MAPIESLKLPKAAISTPLLEVAGRSGRVPGFLSQMVPFFVQMEMQLMHLNRFRAAVERCPKTFEMLIDYRRQIFEIETKEEPMIEPEVPDLDQIDFKEAMVSIKAARKCTFLKGKQTSQAPIRRICERHILRL